MEMFEDMFISEILRIHPETYSVFLANGFEDFNDEELIRNIGHFLKLGTALKTRQVNKDLFIRLLQEKIETEEEVKGLGSIEDKNLNLLALLPCPLKVTLEDKFDKYYKKIRESNQTKLNYLIESNSNNQLNYNEYVKHIECIDDIPDVVISSGINSFYYKGFIDKFIDKGFFVDVMEQSCNPSLSKFHIKDPGGNYTMLFMNILVMAVDLTQIGNLSIPEKWEDLLKPEYEKKVVIRGREGIYCETTLLTIYKEFGYEGIKKLGRNVMAGWHPAQMVKAAGSGKENSPAISVMPYYYTRTIKNQDKVKIVWPKDGAIVSPISMLVKRSKYEELKNIVEFFTGSELGNICAGAYFPSLNEEVDNGLPEDITLNWLGWDFIRANDIEALEDSLNVCFLKEFVK